MLLAYSAFFTADARSDEVNSSTGDTIEEIVVTASRTNRPISAIPNTVKLIDQKAIEEQMATSATLLDGLSFVVPGLTPAHQKMSSNGVTLRGRTPLFMTDGVPQSTPLRDGSRSAFTIDPAFIDRVEVIYGANAIQGVGATGGVINYVTVDVPDDGEWLSKVTTRIATDQFKNDGFHYKLAGMVGKKSGNKDFLIGVARNVEGLYYDGSGDPIAIDPIQGDTMDSSAWNVFAKGGVDFSEHQRLELMANYFEMQGDGDYHVVDGDIVAGIPATSEKGKGPGDPPYNKAKNLSVTYTHDELAEGQLTIQAYYYDFYALYGGGTFGSFQDPDIAPPGTLYDQSALNSEKYGTKLTYVRDNTFWDGLQLASGIDYLRDQTFQDLAQTGRLWVPNMIYKGWAPFVQMEQRLLNDRLRLSFGGRYENATLDVPSFTTVAGSNNTYVEGGAPSFTEFLGNVGVVFDVSEDITVFGSYSQGFNMPDAGLILRSVNTPGQSIDTLIDLQPVVVDNIETGVNYKLDGFNLAASYFWSDSDFGSRILVVDGIGHITRQRTEIEGLEVTASYLFDSGVNSGLAYSHLEGSFDSDDDGVVDKDLDGRNIAPNRINLFVEAPFGTHWRGRLQYTKLLDREFEGGLPEHDFDSYKLVDALITYSDSKLGNFTLGIENLFDEYYISYFSQTLTYTNNSTYFAGRGRAISMGWQKTF